MNRPLFNSFNSSYQYIKCRCRVNFLSNNLITDFIRYFNLFVSD